MVESVALERALGFNIPCRSSYKLQRSALGSIQTAVQTTLNIGRSKPSTARTGALSSTPRALRSLTAFSLITTRYLSWWAPPTSPRHASGSGWTSRKVSRNQSRTMITTTLVDACISALSSSTGRSCRRGASARYPQTVATSNRNKLSAAARTLAPTSAAPRRAPPLHSPRAPSPGTR